MGRKKNSIRNLLLFLLIIHLLTTSLIFAENELILSAEEKEYIANRGPIRAVSIDGGAPLHYKDPRGEVRGIAVSVLDIISEMTGLSFQYSLYDSVYEVFDSGADLIFGASQEYVPEGMILSATYLKSETILFINSSLDPNNLEDKLYAGIEGGDLPSGVKEENAVYFNTREECLDAVEKGKADYGYGNEYGVSYYLIKNGYKNIITIPKGKDIREYAMAFPENDEILISIVNKSIAAIDEKKMQAIILDVASHVERDITLPMIMDRYGVEIILLALFIIFLLVFGIVYNIATNKKLKIQIKRNEVLSRLSNEYLYEYDVKGDSLKLLEGHEEAFRDSRQVREAMDMLRNAILDNKLDGNLHGLELPLLAGERGIFRGVSSNVYNTKGELEIIIGKLINISQEVKEKEKLREQAQIDGLTSLYNSGTTRELINQELKGKDGARQDALLIMDCDNFKAINDSYGHLAGDRVLESIGKALRETFRKTDIIGRIGGDELCVYMKDIDSPDIALQKIQQLQELIKNDNGEYPITVSIGLAYVEDETSYKDIFTKADKALYRAKKKGKGYVEIYQEG